MKAHFLAALLSATYYEVDATAFNFTSDTTATFTNDDGKAFNATFDGVNVFFYCHGANHVENIALNAPVAPALVECEQIIYHTTKDSGVIALKITTENGKFRYIGKYGAGCGLNIDGIKDLIKNNLEWHKKMTLISGVDLLETAPVAPAIVEPVTILDVAPAIVEPVTILDVAPALVEPVTIQTNYLGIKTMGNYKNKAQARRFMVQKVTEKIIEMVTAGDFVVPEQTCAATFTGNAVLRDFALVLAEDAHNSGFGFSKCQFDLLKPDYMRCMVLDDVFGYWSKTADDLRAKLREIQAQRAAVSDISPALVEPVTVLDVAPALVEPVTILEVAPALVEPVTVLEVAPALVEPVTILEVAPAIVITDAVIEVPLASITLSSEVKQFKNNANKTGVVEKLTGKFERAGIKITLRDVASFMRANAGRVLLTVNTQNFGDDLGLNSLKKDDFHAVIYDAPTKTFTSKTGGRFSFDNTNRDFSLSYFSEGGRHGFEFRSNYQTFIIFAAIFEQAAPVVAAPVVVDALQSLRDLSALAIVEPAATVSTPALPCEVSTVAKPLDDAVTVSMVAKPCNDTPIDQDWDKTHPMARRELASFSGMNADFCMGKSSFDLLPYEKVMLNDGLVRKSKGHFKLKGFAIDEVSTVAKTLEDAATVSTPAMPLTLNGFDIAETIAELNTEYGTNNDVWNADKAEVMALSDTDFNAVLDALEEANYRSKYFILKALRSGTDAVVSGFKALDIEQDKAGELTEDIYQKQRALIAQLKGDSLPPTPPTTPTVSTPAKPLDDNATVSTGTNPCEILVKHGNYDIEYNTQTQSIGITFYPVGGFHLMNDKGDYIRMVKRESGSRIACRFKTLQAAQNVADKLLKKSVTKNYIETCDKPKTTTTQMTSPVDWNKENYDIERKQSMTQHGAMKGKLFAENEAKEFTKLTGKNHTVVIEGSHIFDSKGCFENGKFDGQRFNLYRAVQCDEPPTGNNEHKKPVVKETLTTEKPKFKLQPRTTSLTKMARAGIMVLGWFFARELFNAAGQGKIREFLSQGLKMAWNFDALTVADFARFFAQCTDDTKAAKVYALYCQVMPCPLSLEDLMRLSARLNLNPITAQYRRLSIEETRHAMH